jgi:hypothetical protein
VGRTTSQWEASKRDADSHAQRETVVSKMGQLTEDFFFLLVYVITTSSRLAREAAGLMVSNHENHAVNRFQEPQNSRSVEATGAYAIVANSF